MNSPNDKPEVAQVEVMPKEAQEIIQSGGLEVTTATQLREAFTEMFGKAERWIEQAKAIKVTEVSQVRDMKHARELRLSLKAVRCDAKIAHDRIKADALAKGKAIDGIFNVLKALVEPVEAYLQEQEDFAKIMEEKKRKALGESRLTMLASVMDVSNLSLDLGSMQDEHFDALFSGAKAKKEAERAEMERIERERIAEENRMRVAAEERERKRQEELEAAREQARKDAEARSKAEAEAARVRAESEKAIAEANAKAKALREKEAKAHEAAMREADRKAAEAEIKAKQEKAIADAKIEAQRKEVERVTAERNKREAEEKAKVEAERIALENAAKAPDRDKLLAFAAAVEALTVPDMKTESGNVARNAIAEQTIRFGKWIRTRADAI